MGEGTGRQVRQRGASAYTTHHNLCGRQEDCIHASLSYVGGVAKCCAWWVCREAARAEEVQEVTQESQHKAAHFTAQVHEGCKTTYLIGFTVHKASTRCRSLA